MGRCAEEWRSQVSGEVVKTGSVVVEYEIIAFPGYGNNGETVYDIQTIDSIESQEWFESIQDAEDYLLQRLS